MEGPRRRPPAVGPPLPSPLPPRWAPPSPRARPASHVVIPTNDRELLRDPAVRFAAYKHPHPLDNDIVLKVQTSSATTPTAAVSAAATRLEGDFRALLADFRDAVDRRRREAEMIGDE